MLLLQDIGYAHPNKDILFQHISLSVNRQDKIALIGNNGVGKSTLLQIMAGRLQPFEGVMRTDGQPYYIPQIFGQYNELSVAEALQVADKLRALKAITEGDAAIENFSILDDDWGIEERCHDALARWGLEGVDIDRPMSTLSGGQKTKVFLAGIAIHEPEIVLMDEPSNHLDKGSRALLYDYIQEANSALVVVSHDRMLLNLLNTVGELSSNGMTTYGGNYEFYAEQKAIAAHALTEDLRSKEKALRKAKEVERQAIERQQKLDARGRKKQEKAGMPTIVLHMMRNGAENSTARMKDVHAEKTSTISQELNELRKELPDKDKMKLGFDASALHTGKIMIRVKDINYKYDNQMLWKQPMSFEINSGERIAIAGANGAGKTTLIQMMLGKLQPANGTIQRADLKAIYIDQDYSLVNKGLDVYEQALQYNTANLEAHVVKSRLTHFLFNREDWDKPCATLSGGEQMRLILCCLTLSNKAPDMIIMDEPTNNLDIQNVEILTEAINEYKGTLIVVSHDAYFLEEIGVGRVIEVFS